MRNRYLNPWYLWGEVLDLFDATRIDECVCVAAVVAYGCHVAFKLDFWTIILLLTAAQLLFTWFDVGKAVRGFKALCGKGGAAGQ